ncbi:MAG TPA: ABC transporter ATP-binding protein [Nocardioidaceae bacterium]
MLETRGLGRRFGGLQAVADVSVAVPEGEILGVIGPNGAGKSTFINLVTGQLRPSAGQVLVRGKDMTGARPWAMASAGVARTFQIMKPFRGMTVRENVAVGILYGSDRPGTMVKALERADEVLDGVGLAGREEQVPSELSAADSRRLELAKALALDPQLLLLDEVMAGLRPNEITPSLDLIRRLRDRGLTILVVEHVMKAIREVSDRVLVIHQGRVLTSGEPDDVLSDPRVVEAYLGTRYAQRHAEDDAPDRQGASDARDH